MSLHRSKKALRQDTNPTIPVLLAFLTPLANAGISYKFGFVFVGTNLFAALLVWFFLYETAGLSLESVDLMYSDPQVTAWQSSAWAPAGWFSRTKRVKEPLLLDPDESATKAENVDHLPIYKTYSTTSRTTAGARPISSCAPSTAPGADDAVARAAAMDALVIIAATSTF